jgi:hypothetical protein
MTPVVLVEKFAAGLIDTGGGPPLTSNIRKISKKFEMTLKLFSGAVGKMIHTKNLKQKSRDSIPFRTSIDPHTSSLEASF